MNTMRKTLAVCRIYVVCVACLLALSVALPWPSALATDDAVQAAQAAEDAGATPAPTAASVSTVPSPAPAQESKAPSVAFAPGDFAVVELKSGTVNLRKTADAKGIVLAKLPRQSRVEVLEAAAEWVKVTFRNKTGFIKANFLIKADDAALSADGTGNAALTVGAFAQVKLERGTLNLRRSPSESAKIAARLPKDSKVLVLEDDGVWVKINFNGKVGYARADYLAPVTEIPFDVIRQDDKGDAVIALKRQLHGLGYLKSEDINTRYDSALESALTKLQLINNLPLTPGEAGQEVQALLSWGKPVKSKSGYTGTATDEDSGLTVSIFCWDSGSRLYEEDKSVRVQVAFAAQGSGGQPPYTVTVAKSLSENGDSSADEVTSPFPFIWKQDTEALYLYATVQDAAGNTATARARFRYVLPARYTIDPNAID